MAEAFPLKVASLAVQDLSLAALVVSVCHHTDLHLQAGSHLDRALAPSTALLVPSLPTCPWVLPASRTRTSPQQALVVPRQAVPPRKRSSRRHSLRLPRRMAPRSPQQSPRQMQSRLEKVLRLQLPASRLHPHPLSRSLMSQPLWRRRTLSLHSRVVRRKRQVARRVDVSSRLYLLPART